MDFQTSALILAWVVILVLALAMAGLLRQVQVLSAGRARPSARVGPAVGAAAPALRPDGQDDWSTRTVALFLDRSCGVCGQTLRLAEDLATAGDGRLRFLAVFPTDADGLGGGRRVELVEHAQDAFARYQVPATPFGVVIGSDGRIARAAALGSDAHLRQLLDDPHGK